MTNQEINERIATELFGWRWVSWVGIPTKGTPHYPAPCRVRQFISPGHITPVAWQQRVDEAGGRDADGTEPLSYRYCSSLGPEMVPEFQGKDDVQVLIQVRKLWKKNSAQWKCFRECLRPAEDYRVGDYSLAAIEVLDYEKRLADESKPKRVT